MQVPDTRDVLHVRDGMVQSLQRELDSLKAEGLHRWLRQVDGPQGSRISVDGREVIHLAGSDYLGLACWARPGAGPPERRACWVGSTSRPEVSPSHLPALGPMSSETAPSSNT
ncbi:MAG: hypothetical protein F9K13_02365 [Candidatus Methylomirabilis oxygeniifera]|nr:MAG: hypothetical protein F9K13_02365 [Candidatus Methylomirabilis oxyfera]